MFSADGDGFGIAMSTKFFRLDVFHFYADWQIILVSGYRHCEEDLQDDLQTWRLPACVSTWMIVTWSLMIVSSWAWALVRTLTIDRAVRAAWYQGIAQSNMRKIVRFAPVKVALYVGTTQKRLFVFGYGCISTEWRKYISRRRCHFQSILPPRGRRNVFYSGRDSFHLRYRHLEQAVRYWPPSSRHAFDHQNVVQWFGNGGVWGARCDAPRQHYAPSGRGISECRLRPRKFCCTQ